MSQKRLLVRNRYCNWLVAGANSFNQVVGYISPAGSRHVLASWFSSILWVPGTWKPINLYQLSTSWLQLLSSKLRQQRHPKWPSQNLAVPQQAPPCPSFRPGGWSWGCCLSRRWSVALWTAPKPGLETWNAESQYIARILALQNYRIIFFVHLDPFLYIEILCKRLLPRHDRCLSRFLCSVRAAGPGKTLENPGGDTQVSPSCKLPLTCLPAKTLKVPIKMAKVSNLWGKTPFFMARSVEVIPFLGVP